MDINKMIGQMRMNQKQTAMLIVILALAAVVLYINLALRPQAAGIARVVHHLILKLRQILFDRVGQLKFALFPEHHERDRGDRFGHRGDAE